MTQVPLTFDGFDLDQMIDDLAWHYLAPLAAKLEEEFMAELEHPTSVKMPSQAVDERKDRGAGECAPRDYSRSNEHKNTVSGLPTKQGDRITKAK